MLLPLLLTSAGLLAAYLPVLMRWPDLPAAVPFLLLVAGAGWGLWTLRRRKVRFGIAVFAGQVLLLGLQGLWYLHLASYASVQDAPRPGDPAPDIEAVRVRDKATFRLGAQRGRPVLLVFFRGPW